MPAAIFLQHSWPNSMASQHIVFRDASGAGFDHHDAVLGAGDHDVQRAFASLFVGRVGDQFAVHHADAHGAEHVMERDIGNREGRGGADDGQRSRIVRVDRPTDTMPMICVSCWKPSGNSGRIGRSIRRLVRISFSVGRPSRLMKPPGNLPAAYVYSR